MQSEQSNSFSHNNLQFSTLSQEFNQKLALNDNPIIIDDSNSKQNNHLVNCTSILPQNNNYFIQSEIKEDQSSHSPTILDDRYAAQIKQLISANYTFADFQTLCFNIYQNDPILKHHGVIGIRKLLSVENNPPIQQVIDVGLIPTLIEFAYQSEFPQIQLQSIWILTNVASGNSNQCRQIVDMGCINVFLKLLFSPSLSIVQQAIWGLGNIAGDNSNFRDIIINSGGATHLVQIILNNMNDNLIVKNGVWAFSNLCRGSPSPNFQLIKDGLLLLISVLVNNSVNDQSILIDITWALEKHFQMSKMPINNQLIFKLLERLKQMMQSQNIGIKIPSIRIVMKILQNNQNLTNIFFNFGLLETIHSLLIHKKKIVRQHGCNLVQILVQFKFLQIFNNAVIITDLINLFNDKNEVKHDMILLFENISALEYIQPQVILNFFVDSSVISRFENQLKNKDKQIVFSVLNCIDNLCELGQKIKQNNVNCFVQYLWKTNMVPCIQALMYHPSVQLYQIAHEILVKYFSSCQGQQCVANKIIVEYNGNFIFNSQENSNFNSQNNQNPQGAAP